MWALMRLACWAVGASCVLTQGRGNSRHPSPLHCVHVGGTFWSFYRDRVRRAHGKFYEVLWVLWSLLWSQQNGSLRQTVQCHPNPPSLTPVSALAFPPPSSASSPYSLGEIRLEQRAWWSLCFPALFCLDRPVFLQIRPVKGNDGGRVSALMGATLLD